MKKILAGIVLVTSVFTSAGVLASEETENTVKNTVNYNYNATETVAGNSITNPAGTSYKTVLITKDESGDIVYIDQAESGFAAAVDFLLKSGTEKEYGYYTAAFGGAESGTTVSYGFVIGDVTIQAGDKMTVADEAIVQEKTGPSGETLYKKGFTFVTTASKYNDFKSIKLVNKKTSTCIGAIQKKEFTPSDTQTSGDGDITLGITVYNINDKATADNLDLYYSTDGVKEQPEEVTE